MSNSLRKGTAVITGASTGIVYLPATTPILRHFEEKRKQNDHALCPDDLECEPEPRLRAWLGLTQCRSRSCPRQLRAKDLRQIAVGPFLLSLGSVRRISGADIVFGWHCKARARVAATPARYHTGILAYCDSLNDVVRLQERNWRHSRRNTRG